MEHEVNDLSKVSGFLVAKGHWGQDAVIKLERIWGKHSVMPVLFVPEGCDIEFVEAKQTVTQP